LAQTWEEVEHLALLLQQEMDKQVNLWALVPSLLMLVSEQQIHQQAFLVESSRHHQEDF
jgi:hypothetical protein